MKVATNLQDISHISFSQDLQIKITSSKPNIWGLTIIIIHIN